MRASDSRFMQMLLKRAQQLEAMALLLITLQGSMGTGFKSAIKILA